jgi:hypothetical protein
MKEIDTRFRKTDFFFLAYVSHFGEREIYEP